MRHGLFYNNLMARTIDFITKLESLRLNCGVSLRDDLDFEFTVLPYFISVLKSIAGCVAHLLSLDFVFDL